jgi:hypothetical protein
MGDAAPPLFERSARAYRLVNRKTQWIPRSHSLKAIVTLKAADFHAIFPDSRVLIAAIPVNQTVAGPL